VVVLDHTPLGHRFAADHRPGLAALYTTIYTLGTLVTLGTFVVVAGERLFHAYRLWRALWHDGSPGSTRAEQKLTERPDREDPA
jgi:hypothetical protein